MATRSPLTGGSLVVAATGPGASVTSPAGLELFGDFTGSEILRDNGTLRQVRGVLCLADVQPLTETSYSVAFYTTYGSLNGGFYDTTGYTPFSTVTIAQGTSTNQLLVTVNNGDTRQYQYDWSDGGQTCTLTSGNGQRKESRTWAASLLVRTNTIKDASDQVIYQETKYYRDLSDYGRVLIRQVVGPSGPALTTQWFYYDNALTDGTNYGRLKTVIQPSGFWQRYQYDSLGRLAQETSEFLNAATNASDSQCRVVQYDYTSLDGTNNFEALTEQLLGS